mmetsp:Transcript_48387/g.119908  ORF Transcript_48387/g.119908 Transcript_48387/m.119908 type:complete len:446 (-) Transcript_48387:921-2258(-)
MAIIKVKGARRGQKTHLLGSYIFIYKSGRHCLCFRSVHHLMASGHRSLAPGRRFSSRRSSCCSRHRLETAHREHNAVPQEGVLRLDHQLHALRARDARLQQVCGQHDSRVALPRIAEAHRLGLANTQEAEGSVERAQPRAVRREAQLAPAVAQRARRLDARDDEELRGALGERRVDLRLHLRVGGDDTARAAVVSAPRLALERGARRAGGQRGDGVRRVRHLQLVADVVNARHVRREALRHPHGAVGGDRLAVGHDVELLRVQHLPRLAIGAHAAPHHAEGRDEPRVAPPARGLRRAVHAARRLVGGRAAARRVGGERRGGEPRRGGGRRVDVKRRGAHARRALAGGGGGDAERVQPRGRREGARGERRLADGREEAALARDRLEDPLDPRRRARRVVGAEEEGAAAAALPHHEVGGRAVGRRLDRRGRQLRHEPQHAAAAVGRP